MISHKVCPQKPGERIGREDQLAWKIAAMAADNVATDADVAEMTALRILDSWAVALAAINRHPVVSARNLARGFSRPGGATLIGLGRDLQVDAYWAGYANASAIRELDFNDSFFAIDSSHPSDVIGSIVAVAQQKGVGAAALLNGIATAYEVQIALVKGIALNRYRIDHVAHLGPAIAAGLGAMLALPREQIYHAVGLAAHLSVSTRQTRKGDISTYKANAPGHVGQIAVLAIDRAMRGETSPAPVYEGDYGLMAILLGGPNDVSHVELLGTGESKRAILESYPKEHSAGYHGQAIIDLAFRMRKLGLVEDSISDVAIYTKELTHLVMGSGAQDPEKWNPRSSRETLDHSVMFIFTVAFQDGVWDDTASYLPQRAARPDTVDLWRKVRTVADPDWTRAFTDPAPLDKAHGARIAITLNKGRIVEDEIRVANAHPKGAQPFTRADYHKKFRSLTETCVNATETTRFLSTIDALANRESVDPFDLSIKADISDDRAAGKGLFD